jgi:hypothetical protein
MRPYLAGATMLLGWLLLSIAFPSEGRTAPSLYAYPAPYVLADGSYLSSIVTVAPEMATTLMPRIQDLEGIVLLVSWSSLCPTAQTCDFSLIDETLAYWGQRGKKVILGLSTMGPAIKSLSGGAHFVNETPAWVLSGVQTYTAQLTPLGWLPNLPVGENGIPYVPTQVPVYNDPRFIAYVADVVQQLGRRYAGNPILSYVRISLGKLGEDNVIPPEGNGLVAIQAVPGYSLSGYLAYCEQLTQIYENAFPDTQLEIDIGVLADSYAVIATPDEKVAIDSYFQSLALNHVFMAFNGLGAAPAATAPSLAALAKMRIMGEQVGLEEIASVTNPLMQNISVVGQTLAEVQPARLVLFGVDVGGLEYSLKPVPTPKTVTSLQWMASQRMPVGQAAAFDIAILDAAGITVGQ